MILDEESEEILETLGMYLMQFMDDEQTARAILVVETLMRRAWASAASSPRPVVH